MPPSRSWPSQSPSWSPAALWPASRPRASVARTCTAGTVRSTLGDIPPFITGHEPCRHHRGTERPARRHPGQPGPGGRPCRFGLSAVREVLLVQCRAGAGRLSYRALVGPQPDRQVPLSARELRGVHVHHAPVPDREGACRDLWASAAAAACAYRTIMHGFDRLGPIKSHETVVIQGCGPLGTFATAVARDHGAHKILVIEAYGPAAGARRANGRRRRAAGPGRDEGPRRSPQMGAGPHRPAAAPTS